MSGVERWKLVVGWVQHVVVAGMLIASGVAKVFIAPPAVVEGLQRFGLGDQVRLIGAGEMTAALLLLIPRTSSLGVLLVSAFWGGVICIHMAHAESYLFPAAMLVVTWAGAYLRSPGLFGSFFPPAVNAGARATPPDPVLSRGR
jgi:hypothetical protein